MRARGGRVAVLTRNTAAPAERRWHDGFVAHYPNAGAFFEMIKDPDYQQAVVNRTAALLDSRLMRFAPGEGGDTFG